MRKRSSKGKKLDLNELAKAVVDGVTDENPQEESAKDPNAVALGRKGGLKGGKARAAKMTAEERSEAARKASTARWKKPKGRV